MELGALIIAAVLLGADPVPMPTTLVKELRGYTLGERCEVGAWTQPGRLGSDAHLSLADGRLLIFLQVPDDGCSRSSRAVPVVVDSQGRFAWGHPLEGVVTYVSAAPGGALWASTQSSAPLLWTSHDGLRWSNIELPPARTSHGAEERLAALCPADHGVCVELQQPARLGTVHALLWWDMDRTTWGTAVTCSPCPATSRPATPWVREAPPAGAEVLFRGAKASVAIPLSLGVR